MQPFQSGFGLEYYPTLIDKAACIFFSIAGGHIFANGNKRTALLALDLFMVANSVYLTIVDEEMVELAELTASYNERKENLNVNIDRIRDAVRENNVEFRHLKKSSPDLYRSLHRARRSLLKENTFAEPLSR
jgi:death-on-curing family protein